MKNHPRLTARRPRFSESLLWLTSRRSGVRVGTLESAEVFRKGFHPMTHNAVPASSLHNQSGQAIVTLPDGMGGRHDVLLDKHGAIARPRWHVPLLPLCGQGNTIIAAPP
jgi:hypothetical protein